MGRLRTNTNAPELIRKYPNYIELGSFKISKKNKSSSFVVFLFIFPLDLLGYWRIFLPLTYKLPNVPKSNKQFSFEERMGCGFGACMGCSQKTTTGYKRVCKEGPVFYKEEIVWEK